MALLKEKTRLSSHLSICYNQFRIFDNPFAKNLLKSIILSRFMDTNGFPAILLFAILVTLSNMAIFLVAFVNVKINYLTAALIA